MENAKKMDENGNELEPMEDAHIKTDSGDKQSDEASDAQSRDSLSNADQTECQVDVHSENGEYMIVNIFFVLRNLDFHLNQHSLFVFVLIFD